MKKVKKGNDIAIYWPENKNPFFLICPWQGVHFKISIEEFLASFRSDKTAEELKCELDKLAKDVYRYRGKYENSPSGLNINQLCQLYDDTLALYCSDSERIISRDMRDRYNQYAGKFRKVLVIDEQEN